MCVHAFVLPVCANGSEFDANYNEIEKAVKKYLTLLKKPDDDSDDDEMCWEDLLR